MENYPLQGLRVLDLSQYVSGPYCTKLLADYGAEVIKVEDPLNPDVSRFCGPFSDNIPQIESSGLFLYLNTNKKDITLNSKTGAGEKIFSQLVSKADILVENRSHVQKKAIFFAVLHLIRLIPFKLEKNKNHAILAALLARYWMSEITQKNNEE